MGSRILSAGVVVLRRSDDRYLYLLLRAYDYWDFPKGQVEAGETPLEAALREVCEETTIQDLDFCWGRAYRQTAPYNHGSKVARYYIAVTKTEHIELPINPELGRPEHSEYRWVTRAEALPMLTPRVRAVMRWADGIMQRRRRGGKRGRLGVQ